MIFPSLNSYPLSPSNISPNSHRFSNVFLAFFCPNDGFVDLEVSPNTSKYIFVGPVNSVNPPMIPTWICQGTWEARGGPGVALVFENVIFPAAITSGYTPQTHTLGKHLCGSYNININWLYSMKPFMYEAPVSLRLLRCFGVILKPDGFFT